MNPLVSHLDRLEDEVIKWLRASFYESLDPGQQVKVRSKFPHLLVKEDIDMPEPYRIWRTCERYGSLWWEGGISNQPYIMGLEHAVCENAWNLWQEELQGIAKIVRGK